jgi:hypothetical protein
MSEREMIVVEMSPLPTKPRSKPAKPTEKTVKERIQNCRKAEGVEGKQWRRETKAVLIRDALGFGIQLSGNGFDEIEPAPAD